MPVAIALAAGIFISGFIPYQWEMTAALAAVGGAIVLALINHRVSAIVAGAFALGMAAVAITDGRPEAEEIAGRRVRAHGAVTSTRLSNSAQLLTVKIDECLMDDGRRTYPGHLFASVALPSFSPEIAKGDEVELTATFSLIVSDIKLPDETDVGEIMRRKGILVQALVTPDSLRHMSSSSSIRAMIARSERNIRDIILRSPLSKETKEFLATAVAGQNDILTEEMRESFSRSGLAHVLALSGLHAGIIAGLVMLALWPLKFTSLRRFIPLIVIAAIWGFAIVTGMSPSVTRAAIMATVMLGALMLQRRHSPFNALSLAAIIILVFDPLALRSTGFILSFLAVTGILVFSEKINPVSRRHRFIYPLSSMIAVTVAAMLATGIVSAYLFHTFPIYFLMANVAVAPLLPLIVGGGVIITACGAMGWYPGTLCRITDTLCNILIKITDGIAQLPGATIDNIYLRIPELIFGVAAITTLAIALHRQRKKAWIAASATLTICTIMLIMLPVKKTGFGVRIVPSAFRTDIVASSPEAFDIITTADKREHESIVEDARMKYRHHMGRRGISEARITSLETSNSVCRFKYPLLETATHRIVIADRDSIARQPGKIDILLVCRGFKGDIVELASMIEADTILLSSDINPRRRNRYEAECVSAGLAVRNLAEKPYSPESCL